MNSSKEFQNLSMVIHLTLWMCKFDFFTEVHILYTRDTRVLKELSKICLQYCTISNCPSYTAAPHVCGIY